jgi:hypothetical protein
MSIRSHSGSHSSSLSAGLRPSSAIDFKDEFVNSTAVFAASHDETVSHILQRLDQLQSKISNEPVAAPAKPRAVTGDIHSRVATLESIHEDTLQRLGSKLELVERKLSDNREAEALMGKIASKFTAIESQLNANKESEALMDKIASKFSQVEARLQSATQLEDRVAQLESRLLDRVARVESRLTSGNDPWTSDLHSRLSKLEAASVPDPEQERILSRINVKLDQLERGKTAKLGASFEEPKEFLGAEREQRIEYLQNRIEKLKDLRRKYELEEAA